jgi:hypothetical protein
VHLARSEKELDYEIPHSVVIIFFSDGWLMAQPSGNAVDLHGDEEYVCAPAFIK